MNNLSGESDVQNAASDDSGERKKHQQASSSSGGGSTRKSHHYSAGAHNLTEKRRRFKITESLKTLQQLVPGCDKSDQASTLDQTIQYMKSLQDQVTAMSSSVVVAGSGMAAPSPAMYRPATAVHPQYMQPTVPFAAMLPCPHYSACAVMLAPTASSLYQPAAAATAPISLAPAAAGGSHRRQHGSSTGGRSKNSSSLRCKKL
ncbi:hypothetical protein GUJ93_ZPchr0012g19512 [Zizania palustris]|uniref:BHLH domain-containing protein n=1 Tax=Zizania palustris TaxID=103762 RepID=A0A8J5WLL3_ZIZPA|nr:hypothetical protein GUJ93_ZPchr0012g19512 [Zizania palustris]